MKENERFPEPIITPTTKADEGHDLNISKEEIIAQGIVSAEDYAIMEDYTRRIFARGQEIASKHGLILVDTKYEFGKRDGKVYLIDEIHTPDSSRYFYAEGYEEKLAKGEPQRQLSKEFVRQWLINHNFMNEPGQVIPEMTDEYTNSVSERYIELYEHITGNKFVKPTESEDINKRIQDNINNYLATISEGMMEIGKRKVLQAKLNKIISFAREDCMNLSFADYSFDAVTAAFGIRNFSNLEQGLKEMHRVLKPGGHLCVIELTSPISFPIKQVFKIYSHTILPLCGRLISKDRSAYEYLTASIEAFPQGEKMQEILQNIGFTEVKFERLTFGVCTMFLATK